eukprot:s5242_g8.t1
MCTVVHHHGHRLYAIAESLPLLNELRTLRRLRHPNIVLFLGAHVVPSTNDMALVFELIEGQTLHDWIKGQPHPVECDTGKLNILLGISLALRYLHQQDKTLVHGDLKGTNVFVENGNLLPRAKLGDFGLARFLYKTEHTMGGSLRWMAPEIATGHWAWNKDVKPFDGMDRANILKMMRRGSLQKLTWPTESSDLSQLIERIGDSCYRMHPADRLGDHMRAAFLFMGCAVLFPPLLLYLCGNCIRPDIMQAGVLEVLDTCMAMQQGRAAELM